MKMPSGGGRPSVGGSGRGQSIVRLVTNRLATERDTVSGPVVTIAMTVWAVPRVSSYWLTKMARLHRIALPMLICGA